MHRAPTRPSSRGLAALAALALPLALSGCGSDEPETGSPTSEEPTAIEITVEDGTITPKGDRIEVGVGEEVTFTVTSDAAGQVHVHSTPETSSPTRRAPPRRPSPSSVPAWSRSRRTTPTS